MAVQSTTGAIGRGVHTSVAVLDKLAPGGTLEWAVSGSGLGGISDLRLLDTLGDGQRMDTAFRPQVVIRRGSVTLFSGELLGWSGVRSATTAATAINFDLRPTLQAAGLPGGLTDDSIVTVTFHSLILPLYAAAQAPPLGRVLGQGDTLRNSASFTGTVAGSLASSDATVAEPALPTSLLTTSIFAVGGVPVVGAAHAAFGDVVTYRLRLELPLTAAHGVQIVAVAPGLASLLGPAGVFVFDSRATGLAPPGGHAQFGPNGSYTATQPLIAVVTDTAGNTVLRFDFGTIQPVYGNGPGTIDLLFSVPLAPGSSLTLKASETEANSFGLQTPTTAPQAGFTLDEPSLRIQTATVYASNDDAVWSGSGGPFGYSPDFGQFGGVVSSGGLDAEPFADRLSGLDGDDDVTFVIAVQNLVPGAKAYDVVIRATMPAGFVLPDGGASISVTDGAGTPLAYSGDLFDAQGGLMLDATTPLAGYDADSGLNVLLISYTLHSAAGLDLGAAVHASVAQIVHYATRPGWADRSPLAPAADNIAMTEVATVLPSVTIALGAPSDPARAGAALGLGEAATFLITATLPEGLSRALDIAALLPPGFSAVSTRIISVGANITRQTQAADGAGGIAFGDTLNAADGQHTAGDQIVIEVTARPTRTPAGPAPHTVAVGAAVSIGSPGTGSTATGAVTVVVADPVAPGVALAFANPAPDTLRNGQVATFWITLTLPTGVSAHLRIMDSLPAGLTYVPGSARVVQAGGVRSDRGAALAAPFESVAGQLLTLDFGAVDASAVGRQVVVELQARLAAATVGTTLVNSVGAETGYASSAAATLAVLVGNTAPALTGLSSTVAARDDSALAPFARIGVADPDAGQRLTLRITLSNPANGVLTTLGVGAYDQAAGVYTLSGAAAAVTAAAAALRFVPTRGQASLGQSVQTDLSVQVQDSAGALSPLVVTRVTAAATNKAPVIYDAAPGQPIAPGTPVRLFTGLMLRDADAGQLETLTIQFSGQFSGQFSAATVGTLGGTGPGRFDPATATFTSTGTIAALAAEAGGLLFTAASRAAAATAFVTITIDDGAGGVARDTSIITIAASAQSAPPPVAQVPAAGFAPTVPGPQLFIGPSPANLVTVGPSAANLLTGTGSRDAYFVDGYAPGSHWDTLTSFAGADTIVLWGFQPGRSSFTWSDDDGPPGYIGRTLRADMPGAAGTGGATSLTFAGLSASDTDRFAISTGRFTGLDYLSITAPS